MNHPTELALMLCAEEAFAADHPTQVRVAEHLAICASCREAVTALSLERQAIAEAMALDYQHSPNPAGSFQQSARLRDVTLASVTAALVTWLVQWSWKSLFEDAVFSGVIWAASTWTPSLYSVSNELFLVFQEKGADMLTDYLAILVVCLALAALVGLRSVWRKPGILPAIILTLSTATTLVGLAPAGHALELIQENQAVTISADQTVDDTLVITARDVAVHGNVNGNLLIAGEDVEITGNVSGSLITFADDVQASGNVDGMIVAAGDSLELTSAAILGDLWLAGNSIDIDAATKIDGNLTSASSSLEFSGRVGKDLVALAERIYVSGNVGQNVQAAGKLIKITDGASVAGNITYHAEEEDALTVGANSSVQGGVDYQGRPRDLDWGIHFGGSDVVLWSLVWFLAAFIVGWLSLTLFPSLGELQLGAGKEALKTAGIGFLVLVSVPVMALIVAITLVGLPLSFIVMASWLVAWYLAKIILAHVVGRAIFASRHRDPSPALSLLVGLILITAAVSLPLIGGALNLAATIVGLGLLAQLWLQQPTESPALSN